MAFEIFNRRDSYGLGKWPHVVLSSMGYLILNSAVMREYVGKKKYAIFLFDEADRKIGIRFIDKPNKDSYTLTFSSGHCASICARALCNTYKIEIGIGKRVRYTPTFDEKQQILEIDLTQKEESHD